jgi:hypothetical protein
MDDPVIEFGVHIGLRVSEAPVEWTVWLCTRRSLRSKYPDLFLACVKRARKYLQQLEQDFTPSPSSGSFELVQAGKFCGVSA